MDGYLSNKPGNFLDDPEKLYRLRRHEAQAKKLESAYPKAEVKRSSESPKESPPQSPRENRLPTMGEKPQPERKIRELCTPDIVDPPILNLVEIGRPFEIKTSTVCMVQHSPFTDKEDPNLHLQAFIQLCQSFNMDGVTQDQMRARLFPFSLLQKALQWFYSQPTETVQNWDTLMRAFMKEYYSPSKIQSLRHKISTFAQYPILEAFERFNEYTRAVPHHKFPKEDLVQKFYQGLTMTSRTIINASAGGSIIELTPCHTCFSKENQVQSYMHARIT
jgi:hypothetical protein